LDLRYAGPDLNSFGVGLGWAAPGVDLRWRIWAEAHLQKIYADLAKQRKRWA
jgi:hypothetical protein